jgi:hypothetical protein
LGLGCVYITVLDLVGCVTQLLLMAGRDMTVIGIGYLSASVQAFGRPRCRSRSWTQPRGRSPACGTTIWDPLGSRWGCVAPRRRSRSTAASTTPTARAARALATGLGRVQNVFHRISCARINRRNIRNRPCRDTVGSELGRRGRARGARRCLEIAAHMPI